MKRIFLVLVAVFFALCACQKPEDRVDAPTVAIENYASALAKKDSGAMKDRLSEGSIKMLQEAANAQNQSLEQFLTNNPNIFGSNPASIEFRNENVNGQSATVEVKNLQTGTWDKVYLVRENSRWKIALDKALEETVKEVEEKTS